MFQRLAACSRCWSHGQAEIVSLRHYYPNKLKVRVEYNITTYARYCTLPTTTSYIVLICCVHTSLLNKKIK